MSIFNSRSNIERALPYLEDTDMLELSGRVIGKLRDMADEEFEQLELNNSFVFGYQKL